MKSNWFIGDDPSPELSPDHPSGLGAMIGARNAIAIMVAAAGLMWALWKAVQFIAG